MRKLLYINNTLIDLYPDTVIAQTFQAFEVGKLGSVRLNYTNQIKIPKSDANRKALGFSDDSKSSTSFPYTSYVARYVENGLEIIHNGRVVIKESSDDFLLNIFSGPAGFFDYIKTKKLWDIDTLDLNGAWDDAARDGKRNTTTGMVAPLINDGMITYNAVTPAIEHTGGNNKHPWIYYHTVIDKIFSSAGYTKSGAIFSDDKYLKLAMPMKTVFSPPFLAEKEFHAAAPGTEVINPTTSWSRVTFDKVLHSDALGFYGGTNAYFVSNADTALSFFALRFRYNMTVTVSGGTIDIAIVRNNVSVFDTTGLTKTNVGSGTYTTSGTFQLKRDDSVSVRVRTNTGTPTVTITNGNFEGIADNIFNIGVDYNYFNHRFEDINQLDFIADFSVRFNVKMTERNGVIVCKTMDEILADTANKIDWTSKRIKGRNTVHYAYNGLARSNYFTYATDDYTGDLSDDHARGLFSIANENINESQNIYQSLFAMSDMIMYDDRIYIADIPVGSGVDSLGKRLLYIRQNDPTNEPNSNVVYNTTARSDYKVAYFIDPRYSNSMHWQFFIDNYYTKFVAKLQKAKALIRNYNLNDVDIHSFDILKLIQDSSETFIVTKINAYQSGKATQVELFKIT